MRKLVIAVAAVMLAVPVAAPVAAACPRPAPTPTPSISIAPRTGPMYLFDGSANGTGPALPAVDVKARLRHCPPGEFWLRATLVQDGVSMAWATTALGAGEVLCDAASAGRHNVRTIGMGFYGATLHPGRATAHFALMDLRDDVVIAEATRTVWIPRPKHTNPRNR